MLKYKKFRIGPVLGLILLAFLLPAKTYATDLDTITFGSVGVAPNVLIVFDASGSMDETDVVMNGSTVSRISAARTVITNIIDENPGYKWGLFVFPWPTSTPQSGRLIAECQVREKGTSAWTNFMSHINGLNPGGGTPLASALAEAGLYFAGKNSFYWTSAGAIGTEPKVNPYESPIENVCQINYIILLTDGNPSLDNGVLGGWSSTSTAKYNMSTFNSPLWNADYMDGRPIGNYITNNNLGHLISDSDFIFEDYWTPALNNKINGTLNVSSSGFAAINWARVDAGSPSLGHTGLGAHQQLTYTGFSGPASANNSHTANQLIADNIPYIHGYNASDPSRPYPRLTYSPNGANTVLNLAMQGYLEGTQIFQNNLTGDGVYGGDYLDDVAAFLHNEDLRLDMNDDVTSDARYDKQSVKVFVIGFMVDIDLLLRTAVQGGTDKAGYMNANNAEELEAAFATIVTTIKQDLGMFSMPSLPSLAGNETTTGNKAYFGYFLPSSGGWVGNLKRFTLDANNTLGSNATAGGYIKDTATSDWDTTTGSANDINSGGARAVVTRQISNSTRNIYTYLGDASSLIHTSNGIKADNATKLKTFVDSSVNEDPALTELITRVRDLPFGPVIHSSPVVVHYDSPARSVVYVGTNEGFLHAFQDADTAAALKELWAFVMPEHLSQLHNAGKRWPTHGQWFVDGHIASKNINGTNLLVFGARRGGSTYVGLDVTNPESPAFAFEIKPDAADPGKTASHVIGFDIGQSWAKPKFNQIHSSISFTNDAYDEDPDNCVKKETISAYTDKHDIIIFAGGYDEDYDSLTPTDVAPADGAGIFAIQLSGNYPVNRAFSELNHSANPDLFQHSILDLAAVDMNGDTMVDNLYFGDLGGYMFHGLLYEVSTDPATCGVGNYMKLDVSETFVPYVFFRASDSGMANQRKIQYSPDIVRQNNSDYIYFGTGDREWPLDFDVKNAFYCVINNDYSKYVSSIENTSYLTAEDLYNVTNLTATSDKEATISHIQNPEDHGGVIWKGWYFTFEHEGEKVVSSPIVYNGMVFFSTYTPDTGSEPVDPSDLCVGGNASGKGRLYAVDYMSGSALDLEGFGGNQFIDIGDVIPSEVFLAVFENGEVAILVGSMDNGSPGLPKVSLGNISQPNLFYWRQVY